MFKRILVPVDGSSTSNRGVEQAVKLARSDGATLCLLHVVDERVIVQYAEGLAGVSEQVLASLRANGQKVLAKAQAAAERQGVKCKTVLVENVMGGVADIIVDRAKRERADVIVMGTHGRRGLTRLVLGSDAEGVVRNSPVPVLLVRAGTKRETA